jgi:uncharacterized protein (TIGR00297 family)
MITGFGLDNIAITLGTSFLAYCFVYVPAINHYIIPILLTPVIVILVNIKRVLTKSGLYAAIILDLIVSLTLGNEGFILLLSFLLLGVIVDKIKNHKKQKDVISKKGDCRDHVQVIANGLVPMVMALLYSVTYRHFFAVAYVAALAEALADTSSSGFGVFSKSTYDIFKMRKCKCGLSGGMSLAGTIASVVGAFLISGLALALGAVDLKLFFIVALSAFAGGVFDSFLGSVFQIKFKCNICGETVEREVHCGNPAEKISGFSFFDNDVVNLFGTAFSAVLSIVLYILII